MKTVRIYFLGAIALTLGMYPMLMLAPGDGSDDFVSLEKQKVDSYKAKQSASQALQEKILTLKYGHEILRDTKEPISILKSENKPKVVKDKKKVIFFDEKYGISADRKPKDSNMKNELTEENRRKLDEQDSKLMKMLKLREEINKKKRALLDLQQKTEQDMTEEQLADFWEASKSQEEEPFFQAKEANKRVKSKMQKKAQEEMQARREAEMALKKSEAESPSSWTGSRGTNVRKNLYGSFTVPKAKEQVVQN